MTKNQAIVGIDVGTSKIATLIAVPGENGDSVHVVGSATVLSQGVKKSQIVDIEEAIEAITQSIEAAERMAGFSVSQALVSVGGSHITSKNSTGVVAVGQPEGEITADDVRRVIEAARAVSLPSTQEIVHVLPREYKVDSQEGIKDPVGMSGIRLEAEAHLVAGSSTLIRNLTKCVTELGVNLSSLVFTGYAASESVLTSTEKELGVVLIDIGGGTTSIAIWIEGSLAHSAVLPIGARNITNDLAIGMRLSLDSAEKVKRFLSQKLRKPSLPKGEKEADEEDDINLSKLEIAEEQTTASRKTLVDGIIRPRLQEIFTMVGIELKDSGFGGRTPAGVVLTGGGAKTVEIEATCKRVLSLPTRIGTPHTLTGLVDDVLEDPAYAACEGLVLYGLKNQQLSHSSSSLPSFRHIASKIPVKGAANRVIDFLKQFLP